MPRKAAQPDPTDGFSDLQWYMYRQRNVAFFGAYVRDALSQAALVGLARTLVDHAPQLRTGYAGGDPSRPIEDAVLERLIHRDIVPSLEGFPDRWFDAGTHIFERTDLPLFRLRYAEVLDPSDGPRGFLLVQIAHALVEGADSALLSRSRSAKHAAGATASPPSMLSATARALGTLLPPVHLIAANLIDFRPGPYAYGSRAVARPTLTGIARTLGIRQRSLFFSLALDALFDAGASPRMRTISAAYSAVGEGSPGRDPFMRMRMLFAKFEAAGDFPSFARGVEERLASGEVRESGFNAELNASGMRVHRALSRILPLAYGPRLFRFTPFDLILAVIPPHRLTGPLTGGLMEPVYAGAALEGVNACVIVPGRDFVTFNFYIQAKLLERIARLDVVVAALSPRSSSEPQG